MGRWVDERGSVAGWEGRCIGVDGMPQSIYTYKCIYPSTLPRCYRGAPAAAAAAARAGEIGLGFKFFISDKKNPKAKKKPKAISSARAAAAFSDEITLSFFLSLTSQR